MERNYVNLNDLENVLAELGDIKYSDDMMSDEMKASEERCQKYIEKHINKE